MLLRWTWFCLEISLVRIGSKERPRLIWKTLVYPTPTFRIVFENPQLCKSSSLTVFSNNWIVYFRANLEKLSWIACILLSFFRRLCGIIFTSLLTSHHWNRPCLRLGRHLYWRISLYGNLHRGSFSQSHQLPLQLWPKLPYMQRRTSMFPSSCQSEIFLITTCVHQEICHGCHKFPASSLFTDVFAWWMPVQVSKRRWKRGMRTTCVG